MCQKPGASEENIRDFDLYMEQHHGWKKVPKDRQDPKPLKMVEWKKGKLLKKNDGR